MKRWTPSLFQRAFLAFWLSMGLIVAVGMAITAVVASARYDALDGVEPGVLVQQARQAALHGGSAGLRRWILQTQETHPTLDAYVTDMARRDLLGRTLPVRFDNWLAAYMQHVAFDALPANYFDAGKKATWWDVHEIDLGLRADARSVARGPGLGADRGAEFGAGAGAGATTVADDSAQSGAPEDPNRYVLSFLPFDSSHLAVLGVSYVPGLLVLAAFLLSGPACWALARHVSRPVRHLEAGALAIGDGALDVRVEPWLLARNDEVGALARAFEQMAQRVRDMIDAKENLLRDASHELRSPLTRLRLAVELARQRPAGLAETGVDVAQPPGKVGATDAARAAPAALAASADRAADVRAPERACAVVSGGGDADAGMTRQLDRIERECARLDAMVGQLLLLSRLRNAPLAMPRPVAMTELLREVAADARFEAHGMGRDISLQVWAEQMMPDGPDREGGVSDIDYRRNAASAGEASNTASAGNAGNAGNPGNAGNTGTPGNAGNGRNPNDPGKAVQASTPGDPASLTVLGVPALLQSALENLIRNALRFTPPATTVAVSARIRAGLLEMTVSDRGPGVPQKDLQRLFEPFYRGALAPGSGGEDADDGGSGLGLAIVRAVASQHGGAVEAANRPGGGLLMTMRLPLLETAGAVAT